MTEWVDWAFGAFWFAGYAEAAAVMDHLMTEESPAGLGDDLHQILFDFLGVAIFGELPAA